MKPWALVTGASRGIGAAIAEVLAEAGHPVILNFRSNRPAAEHVFARIRSAGGTAELAQFDVVDAQACEAALAGFAQRELEIGIIVNNAGVIRDGPFPAMPLEDWTAVMRCTLDGFYNVTQPLVMPMVRRRWGRIVNISSVSGVVGHRGQTNYSAAKAGLIGATKALSRELAKRNITVNAVAPGLIETGMVSDESTDGLIKHIPMRRLGQPKEVAQLVRFLVSDQAAYITGQVIRIDGGLG